MPSGGPSAAAAADPAAQAGQNNGGSASPAQPGAAASTDPTAQAGQYSGGGYPGGRQPTPGAVKAEVNADLVELSIYGIAALYQKPTPKEPEGGATGNTGTPAGGM